MTAPQFFPSMFNVGRSMFDVHRDIICRPSQFLDDYPQHLVEEWNVGNDNPWSDDEPF
jgi:hypothetical protein